MKLNLNLKILLFSFFFFCFGRSVFAYSEFSDMSFYSGLTGSNLLPGYYKFEQNDSDYNGNLHLGYSYENLTYSNTDPFKNYAGVYNGSTTRTNAGTDLLGSPTIDFSISMWFYPNSNTASLLYRLKSDNQIDNGIVLMADGHLEFYMVNWNGSDSDRLRTTGTINLDAWNNVVVTRSGTAMKIYLNNSDTSSCITGNCTLGASDAWMSGTYVFRTGSYADTNYFFDGKIDELALVKKALTPTEITEINTDSGGYTFLVNSITYSTTTQQLTMGGDCTVPGGLSGVYQMKIQSVTTSTNATTLDPDPSGLWRGRYVTCYINATSTDPLPGIFNAIYDGGGLSGIHTMVVDDSFYNHAETPNDRIWLDWNFSAATSTYWLDASTWVGPHPTSTSIGSAAHNSACTEAQWNTADPTFNWGFATSSVPIFNMVKNKCIVLEALWNIGYGFQDMVQGFINGFIGAFQNIFPFGFVNNILDSWNDSDGQPLPGGMSWLSPDVDGNLYFAMPKELTGANTSTQIMAWGPGIFAINSPIANLFAGIRVLSTILLYVGFIYFCYQLAHSIYDEINFEKTIENHDKINYQL